MMQRKCDHTWRNTGSSPRPASRLSSCITQGSPKHPRITEDLRTSKLLSISATSSRLSATGRNWTLWSYGPKQRISVEPSLHLQYRNGKFVTNTGEVAKTVAEQLVDLLKGNPGISATEFRKLASAKGLGRNVGATFLSNGFHNGTIRRESAGRAKRHYWMGFGDDSAPFLEAA